MDGEVTVSDWVIREGFPEEENLAQRPEMTQERAVQISGKSVFQAERRVSAKTLLQEPAWQLSSSHPGWQKANLPSSFPKPPLSGAHRVWGSGAIIQQHPGSPTAPCPSPLSATHRPLEQPRYMATASNAFWKHSPGNTLGGVPSFTVTSVWALLSLPPMPSSHPGPRSGPGHPVLNPGSIPILQCNLGQVI